MRSLPKSMLNPHKATVAHGPGEAWYYVNRGGLEVCVAERKGLPSSNCVRITRRQMLKALEIIAEAEKP